MTNIIVADGLHMRFGSTHAVRGLSFDAAVGEVVGVIGPNGAGKSTLFGMIAGEHHPSEGTITIGDTDTTGWNASRLANVGVSRTFQVPRVFDRLSPAHNVAVAMDAAGRKFWRSWNDARSDTAMLDRAAEWLDRVGLADTSESAASLGQGDRKLLELAMALSQRPRILLLDEPTAGIGRSEAQGVVSLLTAMHRASPDLTILITAHHMEVITALAHRVLLLAEGAVQLSGTPEEIAHHPDTRRIYLGNGAA